MNKKILFVDDDMDILLAYQRNLRRYFHVTISDSGINGLRKITEEGPFAIVMSDYSMPGMNGIDFLSNVRKIAPDTVRLLITGYADLQVAISSVNEGKVFRFLTKPVETELLISVLNDAKEQYRLVTSEKELMEKTLKGSIKIMVDTLSVTNPFAFSKANKIRSLARQIAEKLKVPNIWELEIAALLSQLGTISIPQEVFEKFHKFEKLNEIEKSLIDNIYTFSADLVKNIPRLETVSEGIRYINFNFEKKTGEENRLSQKDLPLISRILRVVIDFERLVNQQIPPLEIIDKMIIDSGKYDPEILANMNAVISGEDFVRVKKAIPLRNLRITMILAEDMRDEHGTLLLSKGREITDVVLLKLINMSKIRKVVEPIMVFES